MAEQKKYYGAVLETGKIFGALIDAYKGCKKQGIYEADGNKMNVVDIFTGKLKSATMVDGVVTEFKILNHNLTAEMKITNGELTVVSIRAVA